MKIRRLLGFLALAALLTACAPVMLPTPPLDTNDRGGNGGGQPNEDGTISVESVSLEASLIPLIGGQERVLNAVIFPGNATDQNLIWSSGNTSVASIDTEGKVTAKYVSGEALITVLASGGKSAQCVVRVSATGKEPVGTPSATPKAGQITVTWPHPSAPGYARAALTCSTPGETTRTKEVLVSDNPNNSWTFAGLSNGKPYKITIIAHYTDGGFSDAAELENIIPASRITDINLTNLAPKPVTGVSPNAVSLPGSFNQFISVTRTWTRNDNATASDPFYAGKVYAAVLDITAKTGYNFEGLNSASFMYDSNNDGSHDTDTTIAAEIRADYQFAKITITFPPTATVSVSGTISGPGGGLAGATVQLMSGNDPYLAPVTTAGNGTYTIGGVSAGSYTIVVNAPPYAQGTISSFSVNNANVTGKDLTLTKQVTELDISNIITPPTPAAGPFTGLTLTPEQSAQYTGTGTISLVSWKDSGEGSVSIFEPGKIYTATCTLTVKDGWSFAGLAQGNFIYTGAGSHTITSISGTQVTISVTYPVVKWEDVTVTNGTSLPDKLDWIRENGEKGRNYIIELSGPETMTSQSLNAVVNYNTLVNTRITIKGNGNTISLGESGALFSLRGVRNIERITLVLENVTLMGRGDTFSNNSALVNVENYANFEINNTTITGNKSYGSGGGVYINNYVSFSMNGGAINGNTARDGGGVYVGYDGNFTMNRGIISNNTATSSGGGVYLYVYSTTRFTMEGGEISGNTATTGGGVYVNSGIFNKTGGIIYGDTDTTHTPNSIENTATSVPVTGTGNGHAVYVADTRRRNSTTGEDQDISTSRYGTNGGWE